MQDRRDLGRWTIQGKVCYKKIGDFRECDCSSEDISTRGIRLATVEELIPDTQLDLRIQLAEGLNPVYAKGKVVWQAADKDSQEGHFNTGVYFDSIGDQDREAIYNYAYNHKRDEIVNRWFQGL
ncbi:MAG: PilZ domain-containing protein [Candidatus Omnitrophota bacterium]|nr:PilZ domain-containing protein [Candidatus Omnitrophota bacterium]